MSHIFSGCSSLKNVNLPEGITEIQTGAFSGCTNLSSITLSDDVRIIGSKVFSNTAWLKSQSDDIIYIDRCNDLF